MPENKPGPVPADVLAFWRRKGIRPSFSWADVYAEEHKFAFTAAKLMREDLLDIYKEEIDRAVTEGLPFKAFRESIKPRLIDAGWWGDQVVVDPATGESRDVNVPSRLARIYETNLRTARAVGHYDRIQKGAKSRPYLLYQVGPSEHHRPEHLSWHGLLLPVSDPFWATHFPPNGWGCKCSVRSVTQRESDRLQESGVIAPSPEPITAEGGLPTGHVSQRKVPVRTEAPPQSLVPWTNPRTGEARMVPAGVDPGFESTPEQNRKRALGL